MIDPQARRNSLSVVRSFLMRLSHDDERDPVLAMEASAMARVMDDVLNGGVEQEILASLGRIEAGLGVLSVEQKIRRDLNRVDYGMRRSASSVWSLYDEPRKAQVMTLEDFGYVRSSANNSEAIKAALDAADAGVGTLYVRHDDVGQLPPDRETEVLPSGVLRVISKETTVA